MYLPDKRILVTGGCGFLGQHVAARLRELGCRHIFMPRDFDCTNQANVARFLSLHRPEVVLHLATLDDTSRRSGAIHFMEACHGAGVEKLVQVAPADASAVHVAEGHGCATVQLLLDDLYGPGDEFEPEAGHGIAALIRRCLEARECGASYVHIPCGGARRMREFLFVRDAARAVVLAAECVAVAEPVHAGSGRPIDVAELAAIVAHKTGYRGEIVVSVEPDDRGSYVGVACAAELPGFRAMTGLPEGIDQTIAWYLAMRGRRFYAAAA